jgi:hypothetical protein
MSHQLLVLVCGCFCNFLGLGDKKLLKTATLVHITLHYTALHSLDAKLVKMAVGCGICHINTERYVQFN